MVSSGGQAARRTQRLGAYAVVVREDHLLLTRISAVGYPVGWWALPGGGVDHGESPHQTVTRELFEETGLSARSRRLVDVHDVHVVESGRGDVWEDYHGVHLVYAVELDAEEPLPEPRVVDVGGTTDVARWVPLVALPPLAPSSGRLLPVVEHVLGDLPRYGAGR